MPTYRHCANCGIQKPANSAKYCTSPVCQSVGRENIRNSTIARNKVRWAEWKEAGINPTNDNGAGARRGAKIAVSNREKPRRKKTSKTDIK